MSISPISASSLYLEYVNYFLKQEKQEDLSVKNLLARYGVKSTGDAQKDLAKLQEIQTKTAAKGLQSLSEEDTEGFSAVEEVSMPWFSIMYQLGLDPTGDSEQDYREIMSVLVDKVQNAENESDFNKYMGIIDLVDELFIASGVKISEINAASVSEFLGMEILASYKKTEIQGS